MVKNCKYKNHCLLYYRQWLKIVVSYLTYVSIKDIAYYILDNIFSFHSLLYFRQQFQKFLIKYRKKNYF